MCVLKDGYIYPLNHYVIHAFTHSRIHDLIVRHFDAQSITSSNIVFEITETAAIANISNATQFINSLKSYGCRFALDDFGRGMSSFAYLKKLPVDYVKIDGLFVKDIDEDPIDYAMVKSINEVGQLMGLETIAEFVENDDILKKLKAIQVGYAQGYGLGKPTAFS
ncbi:MAG: EAL domain-containing protein [Methylococcaceae bacterium]|nr:EAL domain-containing protein [Methylococcaceae bacterium]